MTKTSCVKVYYAINAVFILALVGCASWYLELVCPDFHLCGWELFPVVGIFCPLFLALGIVLLVISRRLRLSILSRLLPFAAVIHILVVAPLQGDAFAVTGATLCSVIAVAVVVVVLRQRGRLVSNRE